MMMFFVETWACPVSHRRSVGLPRLTPPQCGLAPSHTAAVWACPVSPRRSVGLPPQPKDINP